MQQQLVTAQIEQDLENSNKCRFLVFSSEADRLSSRKNRENILGSMRLLFGTTNREYIISKTVSQIFVICFS